jgi:thioredoxin 1
MVLIKLNNENDDIDIFKKIISHNEECPDLIICYFTATWCGPCKKISPDVSNIGENNDHLRVIKIDVDECEEISAFCQIDCMPTFKFYKNNNLEPVHSFSGADTEELINTIKLLLNTENQENQDNQEHQENQENQELQANQEHQEHQEQQAHQESYQSQYAELNNEIKDF